jgi:hypothetical protein
VERRKSNGSHFLIFVIIIILWAASARKEKLGSSATISTAAPPLKRGVVYETNQKHHVTEEIAKCGTARYRSTENTNTHQKATLDDDWIKRQTADKDTHNIVRRSTTISPSSATKK